MYAWKDASGTLWQRFVAKTPEDLREITRDHGESDVGLEAVAVVADERDGWTLVEAPKAEQP